MNVYVAYAERLGRPTRILGVTFSLEAAQALAATAIRQPVTLDWLDYEGISGPLVSMATHDLTDYSVARFALGVKE